MLLNVNWTCCRISFHNKFVIYFVPVSYKFIISAIFQQNKFLNHNSITYNILQCLYAQFTCWCIGELLLLIYCFTIRIIRFSTLCIFLLANFPKRIACLLKPTCLSSFSRSQSSILHQSSLTQGHSTKR